MSTHKCDQLDRMGSFNIPLELFARRRVPNSLSDVVKSTTGRDRNRRALASYGTWVGMGAYDSL